MMIRICEIATDNATAPDDEGAADSDEA